MSANCPRCAKTLEEQQLDELSFRCCRGCKGMLLPHADLIAVLEKSWHAVPREKAETTSFCVAEGWQNEPVFRCPVCNQTMEKYGYMGIGMIQIDRCDACALVWLDADELQNMVLALAKTNYRSATAWEESQRRDVDIVSPAVQTASQVGRMQRSRGWLFTGSGSRLTPALSLLSLLLE